MSRYFIEVAYKGTKYSGFQVQENANTIQAEIEKAFHTIQRVPVVLTGSSRTDAGVHALQNFFHFDFDEDLNPKLEYKMNAILPGDIVIKALIKTGESAHSRFDALSREYEYRIYKFKDPFLKDFAYYYPYNIDIELLHHTADIIKNNTQFFAFAKTNTQVNNFNCTIYKSNWFSHNNQLVYNIKGNRFLRGMVRLLTATQLQVACKKLSLSDFHSLFSSTNRKCSFSLPPQGLYLTKVEYPDNFFSDK